MLHVESYTSSFFFTIDPTVNYSNSLSRSLHALRSFNEVSRPPPHPPSPLRSRLSWHRRIRRSRVLSTFLLGRISRYCPFKTSALPNEDGDPVLPRSPAPHFHFASGHSIPSQTRLSLLNLLRRRFSQRKERSAKPICIILAEEDEEEGKDLPRTGETRQQTAARSLLSPSADCVQFQTLGVGERDGKA